MQVGFWAELLGLEEVKAEEGGFTDGSKQLIDTLKEPKEKMVSGSGRGRTLSLEKKEH